MAAINFGALCFDYQAIDVLGPTDLLNSSSKALAKALKQYLIPIEDQVIERAPDFKFHHIGLTLEPVKLLTSAVTVVPTTTVDDCPELDILLVGGPNILAFEFPDKFAAFIRRHVASGKLLFTTCTGAGAVAATGALDGKTATVNNIEYEWCVKQYPKVKWTKEKKWIEDGNVWTASGALAGMDMISHWLIKNYGLAVFTHGALGLEYEPRDADGLFTVLPKRFDGQGNQIATHHVPVYN